MPAVEILEQQVPERLRCSINKTLLELPAVLPVIVKNLLKDNVPICSGDAAEGSLLRRVQRDENGQDVIKGLLPIPVHYKQKEINEWLHYQGLLTFDEFWQLIETDNAEELTKKNYPASFLLTCHPKHRVNAIDYVKDKPLKVKAIIEKDAKEALPFEPKPPVPLQAREHKEQSSPFTDLALLPPEFFCPLAKKESKADVIMRNPVMTCDPTCDGTIFELEHIERFFNNPNNLSVNPITNRLLTTTQLLPIHDLRDKITNYLEQHRIHSVFGLMDIIDKKGVDELRSKSYPKNYLNSRFGVKHYPILAYAAFKGNLPVMQALWQDMHQAFGEIANSMLNAQNIEGDTALHLATKNRHIDMICWLLCETKADITIKNREGLLAVQCGGHNLLIMAASDGKIEDVKKLLNANFPTNQRDNGRTAFFCAIEKGHLECAKLCYEKDKEVLNMATDFGTTPLHAAVAFNHLDCVEWLLRNGADITLKNRNGHTALELVDKVYQRTVLVEAYQKVNFECAQIVLEKCPTLATHQDINGQTILHRAATQSLSSSFFDILFEQKVTVDVLDNSAKTPFICAVQSFNADNAKLLIERGADPFAEFSCSNDACQRGGPHSHVAAEFITAEHAEKFKWLREHMFLIQLHRGEQALLPWMLHLLHFGEISPQGKSIIHWLAEKGYSTVLRELAEDRYYQHGKTHTHTRYSTALRSSDCRDEKGFTPEMRALLANKTDTVCLLIKNINRSAFLNVTDPSGMTILLHAAEKGLLPVVEAILSFKKSSEALLKQTEPKNGYNAFLLAVANGHLQCVQLLYGAYPLKERKELRTKAVNLAIQKGKSDVLKFLVDCGSNGTNYFLFAIREGQLQCAQHLFNSNNNVYPIDCFDSNKRTALLIAFEYDRKDCIEWLISQRANLNIARTKARELELPDVVSKIEMWVMTEALSLYTLSKDTGASLDPFDALLKKHPWLVDKKIENEGPFSGLTLLHVAIQHQFKNAVSSLLFKHGAKTTIPCHISLPKDGAAKMDTSSEAPLDEKESSLELVTAGELADYYAKKTIPASADESSPKNLAIAAMVKKASPVNDAIKAELKASAPKPVTVAKPKSDGESSDKKKRGRPKKKSPAEPKVKSEASPSGKEEKTQKTKKRSHDDAATSLEPTPAKRQRSATQKASPEKSLVPESSSTTESSETKDQKGYRLEVKQSSLSWIILKKISTKPSLAGSKFFKPAEDKAQKEQKQQEAPVPPPLSLSSSGSGEASAPASSGMDTGSEQPQVSADAGMSLQMNP